MADLNRVFLMGNLTRDPDVRYTLKGTAIGDLGIAINRQYKDGNGESREEVTYVDIEVWGRQAETCKQYLAKGRSVFIEGSLKFEQWETQDGQKRSKLKVRADRVQFLPSAAMKNGEHVRPRTDPQHENATQRQEPDPLPEDDEIPW